MFESPSESEQPPVIFDDALVLLEGNRQLLVAVAQMVLNQADVDLPAIRTAMVANDTAALIASTHRLKGSLGAIAAMPAYEACTALNKAARTGAVASYAQEFARLNHEICRLFPCLLKWFAESARSGTQHEES